MKEKKYTLVDNDFCDLEPGKICDNCCRCIDSPEAEYNGVLAEFDVLSDEYVLDDVNVINESSESAEIDPALLALWEEKLHQYEERLSALNDLEAAITGGGNLLNFDPDLDEEDEESEEE